MHALIKEPLTDAHKQGIPKNPSHISLLDTHTNINRVQKNNNLAAKCQLLRRLVFFLKHQAARNFSATLKT